MVGSLVRATSHVTSRPEQVLLLTVVGLLSIGLVAIYAASRTQALEALNNPANFVVQQALWVALGLIGAAILRRVGSGQLFRVALPCFVVVVVLLWVVLLPGFGGQAGGSGRSLRILGIGLQPGELAKLTLILYLAAWLPRRRQLLARATAWFLLIMLLVLVPVVLEPDLGTTLVLVAVGLAMFYVVGAPLAVFAALAALDIMALTVLLLIQPDRLTRLFGFVIALGTDQPDSPLLQVRYALRQGGLVGEGITNATQLSGVFPSPYTDSIYAVIAGAFGLVGALFIVVLYGAFVFGGLRVAAAARTTHAALLAAGITIWIGAQASINLAVEVGLAPASGVPLPFVSYGGASVFVGLLAVGILMGVSRESR
jgi:cell division protein FtsW